MVAPATCRRLLASSVLAMTVGFHAPAVARSPHGQTQAPILQGQAAEIGAFGSSGVLFTHGEGGSGPQTLYTCSGVLIATDVVLTAAHCVDEDVSEYHFSFVQDALPYESTDDLPADAVPVRAAVVHPNFGFQNFYDESGHPLRGVASANDIALLFLETAVVDRSPTMLVEADDAAFLHRGASVDIVGYGARNGSGIGGRKFVATTEVTDASDGEMQLGSHDRPRKCYGDSGGPTFLNVDDGKSPARRLVGISSRAANAEAGCEDASIDTRVDYHRGWIEDALVTACQDGLRSHCPGSGRPARPGNPAPDAAAETASAALNRDHGGGCSASTSGNALGFVLAVVVPFHARRREEASNEAIAA